MKKAITYSIPQENPIFAIAHRTLTYVGHSRHHVQFSDLGDPKLKKAFQARCEAIGFGNVPDGRMFPDSPRLKIV